jgi:outer membrane protein OmpA-like peptidoglycan-associated protein
MKQRKHMGLPLILALAIIMNSCGLSSMMSKFETIDYTVTPTQVEVHGGEVSVELSVTVPEKYFNRSATMNFTPKLVWEGGEAAMKSVTLQGEKVSSNGITIGYVTGGKFTYTDAIDYKAEMFTADLYATATATLNDKTKDLGTEKIAEGVMATAMRVANNEVPAIADHTYEMETILEETATIYFSVNQSSVRYSQKSSEDMNRLKEFARLGYKTHSIEISSYASPEGSTDVNDKVSDNRSKSTYNYAKQLLRRLKVDGARNNDLYVKTSKGEDWSGFNSLVTASQMKDKNKVLNIVRQQNDPQKREEAIRDMAEIYDALEDDVLPKLRKATITLRAYQPKKSNAAIDSLATANPAELDNKELLFAAELTDNDFKKMEIYTTATTQFPSDYRGFNNIAAMHIAEGDVAQAKTWLDKANTLSANETAVLENYGIIAAWEGNLDKAQTFFDQGKASDVNQGILDIRQGAYKSAISKLNGNGYNATLAKIMNGSNVSTTTTTAAAHYLNAIAAARSGNNALALENLNKAFALDAALKAEAQNDIEFSGLTIE